MALQLCEQMLTTQACGAWPTGADDFLPVLIYVVIHANPPQLASNLEYIQRFRMQSRMASESAYFFTQLVLACFGSLSPRSSSSAVTPRRGALNGPSRHSCIGNRRGAKRLVHATACHAVY